MKKVLPAIVRPFSAFLLFSPLCLIAAAQTQPSTTTQPMPASAYKLIAVRVTGSKRFTSEEIAAASGLPVGTIAHDQDFKKAARQLGESGAFSSISYTFSYSPAGTKLEFQVTDADKFIPAHFSDFVWFTDEELLKNLRERIPLFDGTLPTSGRMAAEVSDVLQALLVQTGAPGHVEYVRNIGRSEQPDSVDYNVAGVSIRIRNVEFPGASASELPLLQAAAEKLSDREYSRAYMSSFIEHSLLPIYHEHGYLKVACGQAQPKVAKAAVPVTGDNGQPPTVVDVLFPVTPGIRYTLARLGWAGNKDIPTNLLQPFLHAKVGQVANTEQLENDLRAAQELYGSRGHIFALVKVNAEFDDADQTVTFHLVVDEGAVFHMGDLEFRGIDNNLSARLRAAWKIRFGEVYDATYLKQFVPQARKLLPPSLDWEISSHVTANAGEKTVDVDFQCTAKATQ